MRRKKVAAGIPGVGLVVLLLIQLVPYGRTHSNPRTTGAPDWDSPRTEQLARRACYDCHSNNTKWPWYASIAPVSWRIQKHVDEGRSKLNVSNFDQPQEEAHESAEAVESGEMPPWDYVMMHPQSRLSTSDKQALIQGLRATFGDSASEEEEEEEDDD